MPIPFWQYENENEYSKRKAMEEKVKNAPRPAAPARPAPITPPPAPAPTPGLASGRIDELMRKYPPRPAAQQAPSVQRQPAQRPTKEDWKAAAREGLGRLRTDTNVLQALNVPWEWTGGAGLGIIRSHLNKEPITMDTTPTMREFAEAWKRGREYQLTHPVTVKVAEPQGSPAEQWAANTLNKIASGVWGFGLNVATDPLNILMLPSIYGKMAKAGGYATVPTRGLYAPQLVKTGEAAGLGGRVAGLAGRALNVGDIALSYPFGMLGDIAGATGQAIRSGLRRLPDIREAAPLPAGVMEFGTVSHKFGEQRGLFGKEALLPEMPTTPMDAGARVADLTGPERATLHLPPPDAEGKTALWRVISKRQRNVTSLLPAGEALYGKKEWAERAITGVRGDYILERVNVNADDLVVGGRYKEQVRYLPREQAGLWGAETPAAIEAETIVPAQKVEFGGGVEYGPAEGQARLFYDRGEQMRLLEEKSPYEATQPVVETPMASLPMPETAETAEVAARFYDRFPMADLNLKPDVLQYKTQELVDIKTGRTATLAGQPYNPMLVEPIAIWKDPSDGKWYVVNGHQRYGMAKDSGIETVPVSIIDVPTAAEARAIGALQNIAAGHGTAIDAATFFRETGITPEELAKQGVSLKQSVAKTGFALSKLQDSVFNRVRTGALSEARGALIGNFLPDKDVRAQLVARLDELTAKGRTINDATFGELVQSFSSAPKVEVVQNTLFGEDAFTQSLAIERAELAAQITDGLAATRRVMGTAVTHKGMLEEVGSQIAERASTEARTGAEQAADVFRAMKNAKGPVSDMLDAGARRIADGETVRQVAREVTQDLTDNLSEIVAGRYTARGAGTEVVAPRPKPVRPAEAPTAAGVEQPTAPVAPEAQAAEAVAATAQPEIAPGLRYGGAASPQPAVASNAPLPQPVGAAMQPATPGWTGSGGGVPFQPRIPGVVPPRGPLADDLAALRRGLKPAEKDTWKKRWQTTRRKIAESVLDRDWLAEALQRETGVSVHDAIQASYGSRMAGESYVLERQHPILKKAGKDYDRMAEYVNAMRDKDILVRNPDAKLPGGVADPDHALQQLRAEMGDARYRRIEQLGNEFLAVHPTITIDMLLAEGMISREAYNTMRKRYPHYVPFQRQGFDAVDAIMTKGLRSEADISATIIKHMKEEGSERALLDPLEQAQMQVIKVQVDIARNRAAKSLRDALLAKGQQTGETLLRVLKEGEDAPHPGSGWGVMHWLEDGHAVRAVVPQEYAAMAKGLNAETANVLSKIMLKLSSPLRIGATAANPSFLFINPPRDLLSAWFKEGLVPWNKEYLEAIRAVITKNADWHEVARAGGLLGGMSETVLRAGNIKAPRLGAITVKNPLDALLILPRLVMKANELAEQTTRIAVWRKLKAKGVPELERTVRGRNATVDFAKSGNLTRLLNQAIPFMNAGIQGAANTVNMIRTKPGLALVRAAPLVGASVFFWVWNQRFETAGDIPDYEYANNWVVQIGEGTENLDPKYPTKTPQKFPIYIKVPKGPMVAFLTAPAEAIIKAAWAKDDRSVVEHLLEGGKTAMQAMSPIEPSVSGIMPAGLGTVYQLAANKDIFRGRDIVPESEMSRPESQRYGVETSDLARLLGEKFGVSPRTIDFAIQDYTAGTGQAATWLIDLGLNALGYDPETNELAQQKTQAQALSRTPVVGRLIGTKGNQPERVEYASLDRATDAMRNNLYTNSEVKRLVIGFNPPGDTITVDGTPIQVPTAHRTRIVQMSTPLVLAAFDELTKQTWYKQLPDVDKVKALQTVRNDVLANVKANVLYELTGEEQEPLWTEEQARKSVYQTAQKKTYSAMPKYVGISAAQEEKMEKAQSLYSYYRQLYPTLRSTTILALVASQEPEGAALMRIADRLANPARRAYRQRMAQTYSAPSWAQEYMG